MFELNAMAGLEEPEEPVPQPERKRTFSASMRENPRRAASTNPGSPSLDAKGLRTSGIQIHNPQPLSASGSIKKDLEPVQPTPATPPKAVEPQPTVEPKPEARPFSSGFSGSHRNSGGFSNASNTSAPEVAPRTVANTSTGPNPSTTTATPAPVKTNVNPTPTPAKTTVTPTPTPANNLQSKPSGKFAAITAAMREVYNSVKAMKPSATWQKCASDPYLGMQDTNKFAAAFCSVTGETFSIGDSNTNFPLSDIAWPLLFLMMREKLPSKVSAAFKTKEATAYVVGVCDRTLQNPFYFPGAYTMCSWLTEMPVSLIIYSYNTLSFYSPNTPRA